MRSPGGIRRPIEASSPAQSQVDDLLLERLTQRSLAEDVEGPVGMPVRDRDERLQQQIEALLGRKTTGGDQSVRTGVAWPERDVGHRVGDRGDPGAAASEHVAVCVTVGFGERHDEGHVGQGRREVLSLVLPVAPELLVLLCDDDDTGRGQPAGQEDQRRPRGDEDRPIRQRSQPPQQQDVGPQ